MTLSQDHYSVDFGELDEQGWCYARCVCGWDFGAALPTVEDACDALMDHVWHDALEFAWQD